MPDRNRLAELLMSGYNHEDASRYGVSDPSSAPLLRLWASQKPLLQDWLLKSLTYAPMATPASRVGAGMARDNVMAGRLERDMPTRSYDIGRMFRVEGEPVDPGITGGTGYQIPRNSGAELLSRNKDAFWSHEQPLPYPEFMYQGRQWMNDPGPRARSHAQINLAPRGEGSLPGGKRDPVIPADWLGPAFHRDGIVFTGSLPAKGTGGKNYETASFTGQSPADIYAKIDRVDLPKTARDYLLALARQRFGPKPGGKTD